MPMGSVVPARRVLAEADAAYERDGHENLGFLSESHGFLPRDAPLLALPPSHGMWDEVGARLPELYRTLALRRTLQAMPVLDATEAELPDRFVLRASVLLSLFAHAYYYVESEPPESLPASITTPWEQVSDRLQRPAPHLSFTDLNVYNWRVVDDGVDDPMRVENLAMLVPIVGNEDERRFQMVPVEMLATMAPIVGAVVRAQEAVVADDVAALQRELLLVADVMHDLTHVSLPKVNPNPYSPLHVNPVVWGKASAPLATPFDESIPGPSGTAIPSFQLLDTLFGRGTHTTEIGRETGRARAWFPPWWQRFLDAAASPSVAEYVAQRGTRALRGLYGEALDAYAGRTGFLGRHRMKTYGFLDLSFKAGRTKTLGGIAGGFADRVWDRTDAELERARHERFTNFPEVWHHAAVKEVRPLRDDDGWVGEVVLDVEGAGLRYPPGSRCAILPENDEGLVERTLRALRATGDEPIELDARWRDAVRARDGFEGAKVLSLRRLLTFGRIRPIDRTTAKLLRSITEDERLGTIVERRAEDQWELWDLLELLDGRGFDPRRLWKAHPGERASICRVVPPERARLYSISSAVERPGDSAGEIHLTLARLDYDTEATDVSTSGTRHGTASSFLATAADLRGNVSIRIVRPPRFGLPEDPRRPIVMFAGGTGVAPLLSLLRARRAQDEAGEAWLFFATRTQRDLYHRDELAQLVADGELQLRVAISREDVRLVPDLSAGALAFEPGPAQHIGDEMLREDNARRLWELLRDESEGGRGATVYVCGRAGFAAAVMDRMRAVLARFAQGSDEERDAQARDALRRLVGRDRYLQEVYTTYTGPQFDQPRAIDASEVVTRNNDQDGYWAIIKGRVYDLSEFSALHPGGDKIIRSYAGLDATLAYQQVLHDVNPEVDAMLGMYEIGVVRRLDLGAAWCVAVTEHGLRSATAKDLYRAWVNLLYAAVEIENAVANDYGIRHEPVTYDEIDGPTSQSAYKTQLLLQAHDRFVQDYVATLTGPALSDLWSLTSAMAGPDHPVGWMRGAVEDIHRSADAEAAVGLGEELAEALAVAAGPDPDAAADALSWCVACCERVEAEDRRFIREVKLGLRAGVRVFERWERDLAERGATELLTAAQDLPGALARYYGALAAITRDVEHPPPTGRSRGWELVHRS